MTKTELIELTKSDMLSDEVPLLEAENYDEGDVEFKWVVEEDPTNFSINVTMRVIAEGNCVNTKTRKIHLLEE